MAAALENAFNMAKNVLQGNEEKNGYFKELNNVKEEEVARLFMSGQPPEQFMGERPILAIVVGAPGVGKTSRSHYFLNRYLAHKNVIREAGVHLTYDNFYNVSLDTLVQNVKPYRNATRQTHDAVRKAQGTYSKDNRYKQPLTEDQYAAFSDMYLQIVQSKNPNFSIPNQTAKLRTKLGLKPMQGGTIRTKPRSNLKPGLEYHCKHCDGWFKTKKTVTDHYAKYGEPASPVENAGNAGNAENAAAAPAPAPAPVAAAAIVQAVKKSGSLLNAMYDGLEYGLKHSFNVLFDTTLNGTRKKIDERVLPILLRPEITKYKVIIMHITATEADVKHRLQKRHVEMVYEGFLRAVNPKMAGKFITDNQNGFNDAFQAYKDPANKLLAGSKYAPFDFKFFEVINSHGAAPPELTDSPFYSPKKSPSPKSPKYSHGQTMKKSKH